MDNRRTYILYDSRAAVEGMDTDDASILVCCESDEEARTYAGHYGGMACWSYAREKIDNKIHLVDEQWEWNWFDDTGFSDRR
jgi:hypothetical protein